MRTSRLRFSFLLPLLELAVWVAVLLVPATLRGFNNLARNEPGSLTATLSPGAKFEVATWLAVQASPVGVSHAISALNIPGLLGEFLISLATTWPQSWRPFLLNLDVWRAISLPFMALPAWWFAGRGIDFLVSRERPGMASTIFGAALSLLFALLFCGLTFIGKHDGVWWPSWGLALWMLLFAAFPVARIRGNAISTMPAATKPRKR